MYAKVLDKDGSVYYSPVLLLKYSGFSSWSIVFDKNLNNLIKIKFWIKNIPSIQIIDNDLSNYKIKTNNLKSIWNKKIDLFKCKHNIFSKRQIEEAKKFLKEKTFNEFTVLNNENDYNMLLDSAMGFHDDF